MSVQPNGEDEILYGRNAVLEYLKSGEAMKKVLLERDKFSDTTSDIVALLRDCGVPYRFVDRTTLNRLCEGRHQGVIAYVEEFSYRDVDDILEAARAQGEDPFILALDGVEDPHNLGALIRTAEAAGVHGVIIPARRSARVTPAVVKVSAGAAAHVAVARVTNLVQTLKYLQNQGCWIWGAEMDGLDVRKVDLTGSLVWVLGSEGKGLSRLVRESCDQIVSLPMKGKTGSLNVSVAGGVLLYETFLRRIPE
ncbi:MAG: 23S rRNA (guanosine(2251)-2'-O)-methyltransferase RlmB [Peptococcaceae bacterium]|nr:23S rRNA (guanosine(2251)-2'-O)-methyltransferase RlmB [Peptococcaceae bacterium]